MTSICTAYDNIRLIRRKISIENDEILGSEFGAMRDASIARLSDLKNDLVRAVQEFAELGHEQKVSDLIAPRLDQHRHQKRS